MKYSCDVEKFIEEYLVQQLPNPILRTGVQKL